MLTFNDKNKLEIYSELNEMNNNLQTFLIKMFACDPSINYPLDIQNKLIEVGEFLNQLVNK